MQVQTQLIRELWPAETLRVTQLLNALAPHGIFSTGIENSDPWVAGERRDQIREAHDFRQNFEGRLENIKALGIEWLRFGEGYSFVHTGPGAFNFALTDKVIAKCQQLGLHFIIDLLHFGLPEWLHAASPETPFFQNPNFPVAFAEYVRAFTLRHPQVQYFTLVNEPYFTARSSARNGRFNEAILAEGNDDRAYVRATANIAKAAILARIAIEEIWQSEGRPGEPIFLQNDSFQKAYAIRGSGRQAEARRYNMRCFAPSDLIFGHSDESMKKYLLSQGMAEHEYEWFMTHGSKRGMVLGIDYYPGNIRILKQHETINRGPEMPYLLYRITADYWRRYKMPLLHMEINAQPEHALSICKKTYEALKKLRQDGYPVLGMAWFGDDHQVGWQCDLLGPGSHDDYRVGLHYKGAVEPVGLLFSKYARRGFPPLPL